MDIAVVDDKKAIREHIRALIEEQQPGSNIEAFAGGEELLASGKRFDIVFLDIQMERPVRGGFFVERGGWLGA